MNSVLIFAGPSIHGLDAKGFSELDWAPPARKGDILRAVQAGYARIGLIDGVFEQAASVWHKEILFALSHGVQVCGAASMGALRAAECQAFGMVGVGDIFDDYRTGRRTSDGDVAVSHAPAEMGYMPLSLALADCEWAVEEAAAAIAAPSAEAERLLTSGRGQFFKSRSWDSVFSESNLAADRELAWRKAITRLGPLRKVRDAEFLLQNIAKIPDTKLDGFHFSHTSFFEQLMEEIR